MIVKATNDLQVKLTDDFILNFASKNLSKYPVSEKIKLITLIYKI